MSAPRLIPGAPPPPQLGKKSAKKKAANATTSSSNGAPADPATGTALLSKASKAEELPAGPVAADESKEGTNNKQHQSEIQIVLAKRVKVLSKKLQRVTSYEASDRSKLNADQLKAIAAKGVTEAALHELKEVIKAVDSVEAQQESKGGKAEAAVNGEKSSAAHFSTLLRLLHIHSLFFPAPSAEGPTSTFAPSQSLPPALASATAQEVAAIGALFERVSARGLEKQAEAEVGRIVQRGKDEVVEGVSYERIAALLDSLVSDATATTTNGIAAPSLPQLSAEAEAALDAAEAEEREAAAAHSAPKEKAQAESQRNGDVKAAEAEAETTTQAGKKDSEGVAAIRFMQDSEIEEAKLQEAEAEAKANGDAPAAEDVQGMTAGQYLRAGPAVKEAFVAPETPAEAKEEAQASTTIATATAAADPKKLDWSTLDDDEDDTAAHLGDPQKLFDDQKPEVTQAPEAETSEAPKADAQVEGQPKPQSEPRRRQPSSDAKSGARRQQKGSSGSGAGPSTAAPSTNGARTAKPLQGAQPPTAKLVPEVDEDGFVLAASKKTLRAMALAQQQQQEGARKGRGGAAGRGGRGEGERRREREGSEGHGAAGGRGRGGGRAGAGAGGSRNGGDGRAKAPHANGRAPSEREASTADASARAETVAHST